LHIRGKFVHPKPADPPAARDQLLVAQAIGELAVTVRVGVPATAVHLDVQLLPLWVEREIERAAAHRVLRDRIKAAALGPPQHTGGGSQISCRSCTRWKLPRILMACLTIVACARGNQSQELTPGHIAPAFFCVDRCDAKSA